MAQTGGWDRRRQAGGRVWVCAPLILALALAAAGSLRAQGGGAPGAAVADPPAARTVGLPPLVRPFVGPYFGALGGGESAALGAGVYRDVINPTLGALGVQVEGYLGGARGAPGPRGSLAAGVRSPALRLGFGMDVELPSGQAAPFVSIMHPLRRGGLALPGTLLHATWVFGGSNRLRLGFAVPLFQPLTGEDRPGSDRVHLMRRAAVAVPAPAPDALEGAEAELRGWVLRVGDVVVPYLGHAASPRPADDAQVADSLAQLARLLAPGARTAVQVIQEYHASLERALSLALDARAPGSTPAGCALADSVRAQLLASVLLPYDHLLGQKREPETLAPFAAAALTGFRGSRAAALAGPARDRVAWVLSGLLAAMDEVVARQRARWSDARLVWLPLQYALRDEQHASQAQIDSLIARATGSAFSDSNDVAYVHTEQFQWELYRSIHDARSYHVLWIHAFRGVNDAGLPDAVAFSQVVYGYLDALTQRVRAYDSTGVLPEYHIILDEYYFESDRSRLWMAMLRDPLHHPARLRGAPPGWQTTLDSARAELARAVAGSRRLQAEAGQYGQGWLRDKVSVHVHITNQADPSFWSRDILPLVGLTDNALRDHRKIVFYDLTEGDPYRGMLIFTGMGVGEDFASPEWDDRATLVKGPGALAVKRAAATLLEQQGVKPKDLPVFLRPSLTPPVVTQRTPVPRFDLVPATMAQFHNQVGYGEKDATLAKAMLYTLMPPGSVSKVPDSLWNNPLWASLLLGQALRGGRVLLIAPSVRNAPADGAGEMSLAEELLSRLLVARQALAPAIGAAGGMLRIGIYDVAISVDDIPAQIDTALANRARTPWLQQLEPFSPAVVDSLREVSAALRAAGFPPRSASPPGTHDPRHPKLHMKAQFFASAEGWDNLFRDPAWGSLLARYFRDRAALVRSRGQYADFFRVTQPEESRATGGALFSRQAQAQKPERVVYYLLQGSHNEDYRSALVDGEDLLLLSHFGAAVGIEDFVLMPSLCTWIDTVDQLHRYLPRKSARERRLAQWIRIMY